MSAPVPPPPADDPATGWQVCVVATGSPVATFSHRDKAQADADRLNAVARKVWFDVRPVSALPADDERFPPLTAQQLGLCGPRSDDTSVGPDAARHTPPDDDFAAAGPTEAVSESPIHSGTRKIGACTACGTWGPNCGEGLEVCCSDCTHGSVGPAEAAEPATPAMTVPQILARLSELDAQAEANPDPRPLGDPVQMVGRYPVRAAEAGAPAPGYPRIADAITAACEAADIDLTVVHDGRVLDYVPGVVWLATVLDKAGLIDWTAFADETGSDTSTAADPPALALIDDLLRPWAYGYPVNPGYAGRAAQYVSVETLAGWNARRAALASSAAPRVEPALIGTWADPEFRAHADHKHAVASCGYCPSEEDR